MKSLVCEMCGSTDLIKQDGVFVCQHCGCKYSVDEAKKMMVEGTVDVSGSTVKVDVSEKLANLYQLARRAKESGDIESARRYYEQISPLDSENWEPAFYSVYFRVANSTLADVSLNSGTLTSCAASVLGLISEKMKDKEGQLEAIKSIVESCEWFSESVNELSIEQFGTISLGDAKGKLRINCAMAASGVLRELGYNLEKHFPEYNEVHEICANLWKKSIDYELGCLSKTAKKLYLKNDVILQSLKKVEGDIQKYDASYSISQTSDSGGCYVATAVYGSYDCPEVWTLRRFRDDMLAETWYGRAFIHTYYAISPTLVRWFGNAAWFKKMWKPRLDKLVAKLEQRGIKSTPYQDKSW